MVSKKTSLIAYLNYKAENGEDIRLSKFSQRACRIQLSGAKNVKNITTKNENGGQNRNLKCVKSR